MKETVISGVSWGNMEVRINGKKRVFKDCKLWPGGGREWDWGETGTHHSPGVQPADLEEVLTHDVDEVVLGCGVFGRLGVCEQIRVLLQERGIAFHVEKTKKAVVLFNELARQGKRVGGLFHSTC